MSSAAGIRLTGVAKRYGRHTVLPNLDLDIAAGEFVSVLGPSGSGKTTVLKLIAGFEAPDAGSVFLGGSDTTGVAPEHRNIGVVFQNYSLFPHMNVAANVGFPLRMRRMAKSDREEGIRKALTQVALAGYEQRMPHQLSGGQQQRVAIARAIVYQPGVLLMDEPLGALDRRLRGEMQLEIKALHEQLGITIVYVTHDQDEALSMSDRVVVINSGRIEQIGAPREVYRRPTTLFVADFLGDFLSLSVTISEGCAHLRGLSAKIPLPLPINGARLPEGPAKLLWRSDRVYLGSGPASSGEPLVIPASVVTAAYGGAAVRLRVRLATGDVGVISTDEATNLYPGQSISVVLDLSIAAILPIEENKKEVQC